MAKWRSRWVSGLLRKVVIPFILAIALCAHVSDRWTQANVRYGEERSSDWGFSRGQVLDGSPEEVLQASALKAFDKELPHWLHRISGHLAEPVTRLPELPGMFGPKRLVDNTRHELMKSHQVVLIDDQATKHLKLRVVLHEACHVLGFALDSPAAVTSDWELQSHELLCPELWIDEGWPPYKALPMVQGRTMPVWSVFARGEPERSLMVLQARLLSAFPEKQIKALIGYELGRIAFALLSPSIFKAWTDRLSKVFVGGQVLQGVQSISPQKRLLSPLGRTMRESFFGSETRSYSLGTINLNLFGRGSRDAQVPQLYANGIMRPIMEFLAMDMVLKSAAPRVLRPIVWLVVLMRGGPEALMGSMREQFEQMVPIGAGRRKAAWTPVLRVVTPWLKLLAQLAALQSAGAVIATCSRAEVITADRAAALAAGDASEAAAAIMRVFGQMPLEAAKGDELEALLLEAAASAKRHQWELRRQALLSRYTRPAPEERVRALLRWSETGSAQRLMSFAELRRGTFVSSSSWFAWFQPWQFQWTGLWLHLLGHSLLIALVALPFLTHMDLVRWASMCTLAVTILGLLAPMLMGGLGLPWTASMVLACLLLAYSSCAWLVWWNHLLGGSRRWAELSSRLTSQLADQADVTAGIAYLTRDWAEMARRSHAALDQEFCGSWRTSLHEVASKLTDLWQDIRNASLGRHPSPEMVAMERAQSMRLDLGVKEGRLSRADSAPLGHASVALQLWLKVDRAVQRALQVEVERMGKALDSDDTKDLQVMMNWWSASNSTIAGTAAAAANNQSLFNGREDAETETLGSMLLSERLHRRFQYRSFNVGDELREDPGDEASRVGIEEFERLEEALSANFNSLQELKGKLAPMADSAGTLRCPRRRDLAQAAWHLQLMLQGVFAARRKSVKIPDGKLNDSKTLEDSAEERAAEWRIIICLAAATAAGIAGIPYAVAVAGSLLWAALSFGFGVANMVLLLNYQRLSLPHVHRRFERQLGHLSSRREEILLELRELQRSSQKAGAAHARACIFLQSVNVLRNINYVLLCIKTETQRAAAASTSQEMVILGGLRLLLALLPRCEKCWEAEILADDDCGQALTALANGPNSHASILDNAPTVGPLQRLVAESQKRLWILLRMVHLSSVLPIEAQGQLGSLVQRYARPILIEGRVPLQHQALEMQNKDIPREMMEAPSQTKRSPRRSRPPRVPPIALKPYPAYP